VDAAPVPDAARPARRLDTPVEKRPLPGDTLERRLRAGRRDQLYQFLLDYGGIRGAVLHATRVVGEMRANHRLGPLETLVLGQAYVAAGLMTVNLKSPESLTIRVDCSGPIGGLTVDGNAFGEVRGYLVQDPIPMTTDGRVPRLQQLFGTGTLAVTKHLHDGARPFTGVVEMRYGSLAEDLSYYFATSEQTPSALSLSVAFDAAGELTGAGGVFLQALPGARDEQVQDVERLLHQLSSIGAAFAVGEEPRALLERAFGAHEPVIIARRRVVFMCHCSAQRFRRHLGALPRAELQDMLDSGPLPIETTCLYCNTTYRFDRDQIVELLSASD
jgi:molecular chaperone Hsp33